MSVSNVIMAIMALFFTLGAADRLLGHKTGLGKEFERGFSLMGPTALTVLGLIAVAPVIARLIQPVVVPLYGLLGADAAMFSGTFLAPDSGGYAIAAELASDPRLAKLSGMIVAAVMGAVVSFTVPMAYTLIAKEDTKYFAAGILSGFIFDPAACFVGGIAMGLPPQLVLRSLVPVLICALVIVLGLYFVPETMIRVFRAFARCLLVVITVGLVCAAVEKMTGFAVIPGMSPISNGFQILGTLILVLSGALPLLYALRRLLHRPLTRLGGLIGINDAAVAAMLISLTSIVPTYAAYKDMNPRGKVVVAAFTASMSNMFGAHLGFISATDPSIIGPMMLAKVVAGCFAIPTALFFFRRLFGKEENAASS